MKDVADLFDSIDDLLCRTEDAVLVLDELGADLRMLGRKNDRQKRLVKAMRKKISVLLDAFDDAASALGLEEDK